MEVFVKNKKLALDYFKNNYGILKTSEILSAGIYNRTLYKLRDEGIIEQVAYGRYKLASSEVAENISYAEIGSQTKGVFCLTSALSFHKIGTEFPIKHYIALAQNSYKPKIKEYSIEYVYVKNKFLNLGIEEHIISGINIKVYSASRTVVDCFKNRNKIGIDIAIEALQESLNENKASIKEIFEIAIKLRMKNIIMPYMEGLI